MVHLGCGALLAFASPAFAEQADADAPSGANDPRATTDAQRSEMTTKARELFEEGLALYEADNFEPACAKLLESHNTSAEVRTLGLLAACQEKRGLLASAWRTYVDTALLAAERSDELGAVARERAFALEPRVPRLVIKLPKLDGLVVHRDGKLVSSAELESALHLDPGAVELVVAAKRHEEFRARVLMKESEETVVEVRMVPVQPKPDPTPPESEGLSPLVPIGIVTTVLGLGSLGVGIGFGLAAKDANDESTVIHGSCAGSSCDVGRLLREDAQSYASISTATIVGGLVAVAGGTVMFAVGLSGAAGEPTPDEPNATMNLSFGLGHAQLAGSW